MAGARGHDRLLGRSLGGFALRERIGEGGFGAVYRAHQPALDREAVIKVLHGHLLASPAATERFLREARLASRLDHPYAAHIYAFGAEADGERWIAMEMVRGTPLDRVLKVQGPMALERFVPLLERLCEVVHTAHEQGIVHRDIKPANVMVLSRAGRLLPKLLDFGIAKGFTSEGTPNDAGSARTVDATTRTADDISLANTIDTPQTGELTHRGAVMGSPHYMAPEQWVDAGGVDGRTDLYALGVLAYECLTGKPPFAGASMTQVAQAHATAPPPRLPASFPPALDAVFAKVLAKKSEDRYADALEFVAAFRAAAGIATGSTKLPMLDPAQRDAAMTSAPQPIAEAVAALDSARDLYQAREAALQLARTLARYLGILALACRTRVVATDEPSSVAQAFRALYRRTLSDAEWLDLARQLTRSWIDRSDAYPVPELVHAFHGERAAIEDLEAVIAQRGREVASEAALEELIAQAFAKLSQVLGAFSFLHAYVLVVTITGGVAERWMGVRRAARATTAVRGKDLPPGQAALLDEAGAPVLALSPLVQVSASSPGAPLELFLFDGRDPRGAKLVALPAAFEVHDDHLWDWFRTQLADSFEDRSAAQTGERTPYRGLATFSAEDGAMFVGREKQIDTFVNRLQIQPLLAVVGPSGAGKSSFVYAGIGPALGWRVISMRPGSSPLAALIARLEHARIGVADVRQAIDSDRGRLGALLRADAAEHGPVLLVIDQLEEMFTLCQDEDERRIFAEAIAAAARSVDDPVRVIFTLRDDFLVRTEQVPALRNRIGQGLQLLTVPAADDLLRIVVEPARRVGYELEGDLARVMVEEVANRPGALALISFTAARLWELRDRQFRQLTTAAYKQLGGVGGALAHHADVTLDAMPHEERALTREAFRHLVTTENTRAVLTRAELRQLLGGDTRADAAIEKLIGARLLVGSENESGAETIEIVHEALLATWPRLIEWRREDAEGARFREQLRVAARQWDQRSRPKGLLWRGDALAEYTRWRARSAGALTDAETAFAAASLAEAARGRRNVRALIAAALIVLGAGTVVFAVLTARNKATADELHDHLRDQYEDEGRRYVLADDPLRALAYLGKAAELGAGGQAHDFLVAQAVQGTDGELVEVHHDNVVNTAELSNNGSLLITASNDHTARIWDANTGALLYSLPHPGEVRRATFTRDGNRAFTASLDGTVAVWDVGTGKLERRLASHGRLMCAAMSSDGALALTGEAAGDVTLWALADGAIRFRHHLEHGVRACAISRDGAHIAATDSDGKTSLWNLATPDRLLQLAGSAPAQVSIFDADTLVFSPDGTRLVTIAGLTIWDTATAQPVHVLPYRGEIAAAAYSSDGRRIVTAARDHTATVWDAASADKLLTLTGHSADLSAAAFSPDGRQVVTASRDGSAWLWDSSGVVLARWHGHGGPVGRLAFDADGTRVATAGEDGRAIVWRAKPQRAVTWLAGHEGPINTATFSRDGNRVATASDDGTARVWDVQTGGALATLRGHRGRVWDASFAPDGSSLATFGEDGTVRVWDVAVATSRTVWQTTSIGPPAAGLIQWSPDGASIAVASFDGMLRCWDARSGRSRFEVQGHDGHPLYSVAFDPSGQHVITTGADNTVRIRDLSGAERARSFDGDGPLSASYSPDGQHVLTTVKQQKAKIWNAMTGLLERQLIDDVGMSDASWRPDGGFAIGAALDGTARIWDTDRGDVLAIIPHRGELVLARFDSSGQRIVMSGPDGVALHELPSWRGDLSRVLRCRVPYQVHDERLRSSARTWSLECR